MQAVLQASTLLYNRYRILQHQKTGGMSIIYLAEDTRLGNRKCIVKEMFLGNFPTTTDKDEVKRGFQREAEILAKLTHHHLPRVTDYFILGQNHDCYYLIMDYVEGEDLGSILQNQGTMQEKKVVEITLIILEILEYLHSQNIIYRDLKPSNIMRKTDGTIMLIDFGIARRIVTSQPVITAQTMTQQTMVGTPGFAPIEQYHGKAEPRSDLYALGVTIYQLLTAIPINPSKSLKPIKQENPNVSDGLAKIIDKAADMRIDFRYQSASEMKQALQKLSQPALITVVTASATPSTFTPNPAILQMFQDIDMPNLKDAPDHFHKEFRQRNINAFNKALNFYETGFVKSSIKELCWINRRLSSLFINNDDPGNELIYGFLHLLGKLQEEKNALTEARQCYQDSIKYKAQNKKAYQDLQKVEHKIQLETFWQKTLRFANDQLHIKHALKLATDGKSWSIFMMLVCLTIIALGITYNMKISLFESIEKTIVSYFYVLASMALIWFGGISFIYRCRTFDFLWFFILFASGIFIFTAVFTYGIFRVTCVNELGPRAQVIRKTQEVQRTEDSNSNPQKPATSSTSNSVPDNDDNNDYNIEWGHKAVKYGKEMKKTASNSLMVNWGPRAEKLFINKDFLQKQLEKKNTRNKTDQIKDMRKELGY